MVLNDYTLYIKENEKQTPIKFNNVTHSSLSYDFSGNENCGFNLTQEFNITIENSEQLNELFETICSDCVNDPIQRSIEYTIQNQVQARCHKKKRINKKWLKRYGYRTVYNLMSSDMFDCSVKVENGVATVEANIGYPKNKLLKRG